jgi:hypothetical protein
MNALVTAMAANLAEVDGLLEAVLAEQRRLLHVLGATL